MFIMNLLMHLSVVSYRPEKVKNPVIKIMFSVVKINDFVFNSKLLLFDFAVVFWFNLMLVACCAIYVN